MLSKSVRNKLEKTAPVRKRSVGRLLHISTHYFTHWAERRWRRDGWWNINPAHIRLMSIIGYDGISNKELAKRSRVSKQAMSKSVSELLKHRFIELEKHPTDARSKMISLSKKGADFMFYLQTTMGDMEKEFHSIIGKQKTETLINILYELVEGILKREEEAPPKPSSRRETVRDETPSGRA